MAIARGTTPGDDAPNAFYLLDVSNRRTLSQVASLESDDEIKSGLVAIQSQIFVVTSGEEGDQLVSLDAADQLAQKSNVPLGAGYVSGPWSLGASLLVGTDAGELVCFDDQLEKKWALELPNDQFAGHPRLLGDKIMLAFRSGKISLVNPLDGKVSSEVDLGHPLNHVPVDWNQQLIFSGADGTIHLMDPTKL